MPALKLNTIYEANGYVNGVALFGQSEEFKVPGLKPKHTDHKALGIAGTVDIPTGFDKMEFSTKLNSLYPEGVAQFANIYDELLVIVFGNLQKWEGNTLVEEVPVKMTIKGKSKGTPDITIKHQDNPELDKMMSVTSVKMEVDNETIYHLDLIANIYMVNGTDLWATRRQNLGL